MNWVIRLFLLTLTHQRANVEHLCQCGDWTECQPSQQMRQLFCIYQILLFLLNSTRMGGDGIKMGCVFVSFKCLCADTQSTGYFAVTVVLFDLMPYSRQFVLDMHNLLYSSELDRILLESESDLSDKALLLTTN